MMSPVTDSFGKQIAGLERMLRDGASSLTADGGFARFVYTTSGETCPLQEMVIAIDADSLRQGRAPELASVGYLACERHPLVNDEIRHAWLEGIGRLSLRDSFPLDHQTFAYRPIEVLGIALGLSCIVNLPATTHDWMKGVVERLQKDGGKDPWSLILCSLAATTIGVSWSGSLPDVTSCQIDELALLRWYLVYVRKSDGVYRPAEIDARLLRMAAAMNVGQQTLGRAAVMHHSIRAAVVDNIQSEIERTWEVGRPAQDAVHLIEGICRKFHVFARSLLKRHDNRATVEISDEYDVQDLMNALLRLHFEDVRAEEVSPSYAGSSSRMDFLLKREQVVVEVKMTRANLRQKRVVSQLIEDKERYRTHHDCRVLVCFVYDPGGYCDNPAALEDDVSELEGDLPVKVIVAPKGN